MPSLAASFLIAATINEGGNVEDVPFIQTLVSIVLVATGIFMATWLPGQYQNMIDRKVADGYKNRPPHSQTRAISFIIGLLVFAVYFGLVVWQQIDYRNIQDTVTSLNEYNRQLEFDLNNYADGCSDSARVNCGKPVRVGE